MTTNTLSLNLAERTSRKSQKREKKKKKFYFSPRQRSASVPGAPATGGQLCVAKWILSGSGISAECTPPPPPPPPLQVLLIIRLHIKLQKAANAVLMLRRERSHFSAVADLPIQTSRFYLPPFFPCSAPSVPQFPLHRFYPPLRPVRDPGPIFQQSTTLQRNPEPFFFFHPVFRQNVINR